MAWTTPMSWTPGQVPGASDFNTHLRDNLNYVHSGKPAVVIARNNGSAYTIAAASGWQPVDATNLVATINTTTERALITLTCTLTASAGADEIYLDVELDGARMGDARGLAVVMPSVNKQPGVLCIFRVGLSTGSHTFKLFWKVSSGTATMHSDANNRVHFAVAEW